MRIQNVMVFLTLLLIAGGAQASDIIEKLKDREASAYRVGVLSLELDAYALTEKWKDKSYRHLRYITLKKVSVIEEKENVYFQLSATTEVTEVTDKECKNLYGNYANDVDFKTRVEGLFDLSKREYEKLHGRMMLRVKLISKENKKFFVLCH